MNPIVVIMLIAFLPFCSAWGLYSRRHASDVNGFVLGGRSVGPWLTAFAFGTSYFSAVILSAMPVSSAGVRSGLHMGRPRQRLHRLAAAVGDPRPPHARVMTQHLNSRTMPDFFGLRFLSPGLKTVAALIVFVFLILYTASLFNGLSRLFTMAFPQIDYAWCVIVMAVLTGVYVIIGGYMATAINDFIQGVIMIVGIVAVIAAVLHGQGGFSEAVARLRRPGCTGRGTQQLGAFTSFFGADPLFFAVRGHFDLAGHVGVCRRWSASFTPSRMRIPSARGTVISTVFAIIVAGGCYFLGGFGRLFAESVSYQADGVTPVYDSIIQPCSPALRRCSSAWCSCWCSRRRCRRFRRWC